MTTILNELGATLNRAWQGLSSGWRELMRAAGSALTRYTPSNAMATQDSRDWPVRRPAWGLLPGEVIETSKSVVVQLELPGVDRDDVELTVEGNCLRIRGEKRADREYFAETYYLRERAYGRFERLVPLPQEVDSSAARAYYRAGVLSVELPKVGPSRRRRLTVQ